MRVLFTLLVLVSAATAWGQSLNQNKEWQLRPKARFDFSVHRSTDWHKEEQ